MTYPTYTTYMREYHGKIEKWVEIDFAKFTRLAGKLRVWSNIMVERCEHESVMVNELGDDVCSHCGEFEEFFNE